MFEKGLARIFENGNGRNYENVEARGLKLSVYDGILVVVDVCNFWLVLMGIVGARAV